MGEEGFSSDSSLLYHAHPPTAIVKSEAVAEVASEPRLAANHPLLPRHYRTQDLTGDGDVVLGRQPLMGNEDITISFATVIAASEFYRNSIGAETVSAQGGSRRFESVSGSIAAVAGDYIVAPRGTIHRWLPVPAETDQPGSGPAVTALVIEA